MKPRVITRLVVQKRDRERVNVYLDDEFAFGLAMKEALRLKLGQSLDDGEIEALKLADRHHKLYGRALDQLSRRPRSRRELERYLAGKDGSPDEIEAVLARLEKAGYMDDLAFASFWVENRERFRPKGKRAIRYELRQKGVNETIIDQALEELDVDEVESAYRAAQKRLRRLEVIEDRWEFRRRLGDYLGRRGFGWDTVREVADRCWAERERPDE